ncbi:MAG: tRNA dihydrouridine synthase DusB [Firmicutes bacterium]|nr:tRNA dihydrouridine synthase DusB [Bacillota bacterium]
MIILAPMAGVTDLAFRLLAKEYGCDLTVSEMISAQGLLYNNERTKQLLLSDRREKPFVVQLFGHDPTALGKAAEIVANEYQPDMIDLNMGCPTPKIVKNNDGAALLKDPALVERIVNEVVSRVNIPVTVKIRIGWDEQSINCLEIAKRIEQGGAYWITVHGRTREQFYSGQAQWNWIGLVKEAVSIPVVGNGDIFTAEDASRMLAETGCDHIMIGRGALGAPWIFQQVKAYLEKGEIIEPPSLPERVAIALRHLELKIKFDGEQQAVREMRSHLAWYLKGIPNSNKIRAQLNQVSTYQEVRLLLNKVIS